jgi:hypothetical protein
MLQPSDILASHFRAYEFAERTGQRDRLPEDPETCANIARLACAYLQPFRNAWHEFQAVYHAGDGWPHIKLICGWRSKEHNVAVGGVPQSLHVEGLAADVCCDVDWRSLREGLGTLRDADRMELFAKFSEKYIDGGDNFGGFGIYRNRPTGHPYWIHLDARPRVNGHVARWTGTHIGSER